MSPAMAYYSGLSSEDPFPGQDPAPPGPEQPQIPLLEESWEEAWWQAMVDEAIAEVAAEAEKAKESK